MRPWIKMKRLSLVFDLDTVDEEPPCGCENANSHLFIVYLFIEREDKNLSQMKAQ